MKHTRRVGRFWAVSDTKAAWPSRDIANIGSGWSSYPTDDWREMNTAPSVVGFDRPRCPPVAFLREHNANELPVLPWHALEYPLVLKWGGQLEKSGTIATAIYHRSFRLHIGEAKQTN
jgi:hypothetical protein